MVFMRLGDPHQDGQKKLKVFLRLPPALSRFLGVIQVPVMWAQPKQSCVLWTSECFWRWGIDRSYLGHTYHTVALQEGKSPVQDMINGDVTN
jgi:hypothetical protein